MKLETKLESLIPSGDGPFRITAFELTHDGEGWSVNTPFNIGSNLDRQETISRLRSRWEIFKANYDAKARVSDLQDIGDGDESISFLEVGCNAFATIQRRHVHNWGPVEHARLTGNPHRKCTGCNEITLDLED
jgi:hypothetical protein